MRSGIVLAFVVAIVGSAPPAVAQVQSPYSEWSRVRRVEAGTEITVLRNRVGPSRRSFVRADDTELTVLNLTDPALPPAAVKMLRTLMTNRPEYFVRQHTVVDGNIHIGPAGLFVADRKVANFGQIVEFIPRAEVAAIAGPAKTRGSWVGAGIGAGAGLLLGVAVLVSAIDCPHTDNCEAWPWRLTAPFWLPVALGMYAYRTSGHEVGSVIYQAP
jgi:hypothetical protein